MVGGGGVPGMPVRPPMVRPTDTVPIFNPFIVPVQCLFVFRCDKVDILLDGVVGAPHVRQGTAFEYPLPALQEPNPDMSTSCWGDFSARINIQSPLRVVLLAARSMLIKPRLPLMRKIKRNVVDESCSTSFHMKNRAPQIAYNRHAQHATLTCLSTPSLGR